MKSLSFRSGRLIPVFVLCLLVGISAGSSAQKVPINFNDFHGYTGTVDYLKKVEKAYPDIAELVEIGKSTLGRPIYVLIITNKKTGSTIDVQDDGTVSIASSDEESARKAIQIVEELTAVAEVGKTYLGKVQRIVDFGAFIEILPGTDGLLHISEVADYRVKEVRDELSEGDQVLVKVINIDPQGKVKLSRRAVLKEQAGEPYEPAEPPPRRDRGDRGDRGNRHRRPRRPGGGGGRRDRDRDR